MTSWNRPITILLIGLAVVCLLAFWQHGRTAGSPPPRQAALPTPLRTMVATKQTSTGRTPWALEIDPGSGHAFVANLTDDTVSMYDTHRLTKIKVIPVGRRPVKIEVDQRSGRGDQAADHYGAGGEITRNGRGR